MDRRMSVALDRHITGNYGEDQGRDVNNMEERKKKLFKDITVKLKLSEYTIDRMDEFSEANNVSVASLIEKCVKHCESINYF